MPTLFLGPLLPVSALKNEQLDKNVGHAIIAAEIIRQDSASKTKAGWLYVGCRTGGIEHEESNGGVPDGHQ